MDRSDPPFTYDPLLVRDGAQVSKSPWGPSDEIGRLNWITPDAQRDILARLDGSKIFDLAVDYFVGMPSWAAAGDPPFGIFMTHTPQGSVNETSAAERRKAYEKFSYCGDAISMYTHCGTHIDTLNHLGYFGCFWNGRTAQADLGSRSWNWGGTDKFPPIVARGVLLDMARFHGVACLPDGHAVGRAELKDMARAQGVELRQGDVVCLRTGRMTKWPDTERYLVDPPGLSVAGARYLCEEMGTMIVACDAIGLDPYPAVNPTEYLPVHSYMFATAGAPIMEVVWMEELAAERQYEFAMLAFPLKIRGATAAPVRPLAVRLR